MEENKEETTSVVVPKARGRGRPPKSDLAAVKDRTKGKVGRPKGDSGRMQEFKERLLATGGNRIIDKVVQVALNDDHPGQMAALKLCLERTLPVSMFEAAKAGGSPQISINISGLSSPTVEAIEDITDVEVRDV
jgi:hypothetical protein